MRRTADQLNRTAVQEGKGKTAKAGEHILICLSSAPSNAKVIRTAARMAEAFHSGFTALFVQTPETNELSGENLKRLRSNLRLAEQLGAQISTVYGTDPAMQIAEYARVSGVTKIVMGRVNHKQNPITGKKSLADRLIELTDLDVYIIPDHQPLYKNPLGKPRVPRARFTWRDTGITLTSLLLSSIAGFGFYHAGFSESNIITVYILGVLITAVWTNGHLYGANRFFPQRRRFQFSFYRAAFYLSGRRSQLPCNLSDHAFLQFYCELSGQPRKGAGSFSGTKELLYGTAFGEQSKAAKRADRMGLPSVDCGTVKSAF